MLGWAAEVDFRELVEMMVDADVARHPVGGTRGRPPAEGAGAAR